MPPWGAEVWLRDPDTDATPTDATALLKVTYLYRFTASRVLALNILRVNPDQPSARGHEFAKEPKYVAASQEYCLLAFGPKAETRVWLVRDGDVLYVDRNGNRDLTEPGEAVRKTGEQYRFPCGDITSRDGKTKYQVVGESRS